MQNPILKYLEERETVFTDKYEYMLDHRLYHYDRDQIILSGKEPTKTQEIELARYSTQRVNELKSHISATTTGLLEAVEKWAGEKRRVLGVFADPTDALMLAYKNRDYGYNVALQDLLAFISEAKKR